MLDMEISQEYIRQIKLRSNSDEMHTPLGKVQIKYYYTIVTIETQSEIPQLSHKSYFLYIYIHYGTQIHTGISKIHYNRSN